MNHSDQSTSEDNFEPKTNSRRSSSFASKKKPIKKVESTSTDEILDLEQESDFPQSIERTRYNQTSDQGLLAAILDPKRMYLKQSSYKDQQRSKDKALKIFDKNSQISQDIIRSNKERDFHQKVSSPYQNLFDDRISIQTMDSKQFTSCFEYSQRQLIQIGSHSEQRNSFTKHVVNDKNYFDNHIIEHINEQDEQRESNNVYIYEQQRNSRLIELQTPLNQQQQKKFTLMNQSTKIKQSPSIKELNPFETKLMIRQKQNQINQLKQAYVQTTNQNDALKNRVKQLQACLQAIAQQRQQENSLFKNPQFQINQQQFKKAVKIFRKFSL